MALKVSLNILVHSTVPELCKSWDYIKKSLVRFPHAVMRIFTGKPFSEGRTLGTTRYI